MCAKYSDFVCIWLRKCDFLSGKVRYWSDPDPKLFIPDPDPDPAKSSGSGSGSGSCNTAYEQHLFGLKNACVKLPNKIYLSHFVYPNTVDANQQTFSPIICAIVSSMIVYNVYQKEK